MIFAAIAIAVFTALFVGFILTGARQRADHVTRLYTPAKPVSYHEYTGPLYNAHGREIRPAQRRFI